jgi:hypothetical protein
MYKVVRFASTLLVGILATCLSAGQVRDKPVIPVGIFLGRIEEGARILTPVRLLPFDFPESEGHYFPNALQLFGTEFEVIVWVGRQAGYDLGSTLLRYPKEPSLDWSYPEFLPPSDTSSLRETPCIRRPKADAPIPGLRGVL